MAALTTRMYYVLLYLFVVVIVVVDVFPYIVIFFCLFFSGLIHNYKQEDQTQRCPRNVTEYGKTLCTTDY